MPFSSLWPHLFHGPGRPFRVVHEAQNCLLVHLKSSSIVSEIKVANVKDSKLTEFLAILSYVNNGSFSLPSFTFLLYCVLAYPVVLSLHPPPPTTFVGILAPKYANISHGFPPSPHVMSTRTMHVTLQAPPHPTPPPLPTPKGHNVKLSSLLVSHVVFLQQ